MKRILVSWIGHTDLKAMAASAPASRSKAVRAIVGDTIDSKVGAGPLKTLLDQESFGQVHLLADYGPAASKEFAAWIGGDPKLHDVTLKTPTDHGEILAVVRPILNGLKRKKDDELVFHLSPGTPANGGDLDFVSQEPVPRNDVPNVQRQSHQNGNPVRHHHGRSAQLASRP